MKENTAEQQMASGDESPSRATDAMRIVIYENGPYIVMGGIPLDEQIITPVERHYEYRKVRDFAVPETYTLCRCGHTTTPPYCDGSHVEAHVDGTETASRAPYEKRAEVFRGAGVTLLDDNRCAYARFCHREEGEVWTLTKRSGDEHLKQEAIIASSECPAGRLTHIDAETGTVYEPDLAPSITLLQDPQKKVSGPLFVQGGIPLVSADGTEYELRNRYTLCRCGASRNKPFCDAMHVNAAFHDGLEQE